MVINIGQAWIQDQVLKWGVHRKVVVKVGKEDKEPTARSGGEDGGNCVASSGQTMLTVSPHVQHKAR